MRLLHIQADESFTFVEFIGAEVPPYAILSHCWGPNGTEVTYKDMIDGTGSSKLGYSKLRSCAKQTIAHNLSYFWVDTCCIDKSSSAELSEAINSMYNWYQGSEICFAYLEDVPSKVEISRSSMANVKWFTRGWTLQELVASDIVSFFSADWAFLGDKYHYSEALASITGIHAPALRSEPIESFSIAQRMSWASHRVTTRPEDIAYCLLGIFNVNMPLLYGEGAYKAFIRLQEEIMEMSDDESLFVWEDKTADVHDLHGLLADSPAMFAASSEVVPIRNPKQSSPYSKTNAGIRITLHLSHLFRPSSGPDNHREWICLAQLNCGAPTADGSMQASSIGFACLTDGGDQYARTLTGSNRPHENEKKERWTSVIKTVYVRNDVTSDDLGPLAIVRSAEPRNWYSPSWLPPELTWGRQRYDVEQVRTSSHQETSHFHRGTNAPQVTKKLPSDSNVRSDNDRATARYVWDKEVRFRETELSERIPPMYISIISVFCVEVLRCWLEEVYPWQVWYTIVMDCWTMVLFWTMARVW